jgi:hypothetical protein
MCSLHYFVEKWVSLQQFLSFHQQFLTYVYNHEIYCYVEEIGDLSLAEMWVYYTLMVEREPAKVVEQPMRPLKHGFLRMALLCNDHMNCRNHLVWQLPARLTDYLWSSRRIIAGKAREDHNSCESRDIVLEWFSQRISDCHISIYVFEVSKNKECDCMSLEYVNPFICLCMHMTSASLCFFRSVGNNGRPRDLLDG